MRIPVHVTAWPTQHKGGWTQGVINAMHTRMPENELICGVGKAEPFCYSAVCIAKRRSQDVVVSHLYSAEGKTAVRLAPWMIDVQDDTCRNCGCYAFFTRSFKRVGGKK